MESVAGLDRTTPLNSKSETACNPYKSNSIPLFRLKEHLSGRWNVEITLTQNCFNRKKGVNEANDKVEKDINILFKKYALKRDIKYYLVYEFHKAQCLHNDAYLHLHGILSFSEKYTYERYLQIVATTIKWFYRHNLKANWCRISSLDVSYPISEGNIDRKVGNFTKWYDYIHKIDNSVTILPIENNIVEKNLTFRRRYVNSEFFDIFYIEDSDGD